MVTRQSVPLAGAGRAAPPDPMGDYMAQQMRLSGRADMGGSAGASPYQAAKNLAGEDSSTGEDAAGDIMGAVATDAEPAKAGTPNGDVAALPGYGMDPSGSPTAETSPVITGKQNESLIDGEGNVTDPAASTDSLAGKDEEPPKGGTPSVREEPPKGGTPSVEETGFDGAVQRIGRQVAKDWDAPGYGDFGAENPGRITSDPLAVEVQGVGIEDAPGGREDNRGVDGGSITPSGPETVLRQPTLVSGEIGGRLERQN